MRDPNRLLCRFRGCPGVAYRDVGPHPLQALLRNSVNGEDVFDALKRSAFFAEINY